jgi:hypothetical protein
MGRLVGSRLRLRDPPPAPTLAWFYWSMILGVLAILVATLVLDFAASWVFLIHCRSIAPVSGATPDRAVPLGVLLAGLSIITWCLGLLRTVVGPALRDELERLQPARIGSAWATCGGASHEPRSIPIR